jgi:hypothetical protein
MTSPPSNPKRRVAIAVDDLTLGLAQYGRAMLAIQLFEFSLSTYVLVLKIDPERRPRALHRELRRIIRRGFHAYRRASASETARDLERFVAEGRVEAELHTEIRNAIKWRDRLAHRYLREALVRDRDGRPALREGSTGDLARLARGFDRLGRQLEQEVNRIVAQWPMPDLPPEVQEVLTHLAAKLALDRDLPPVKQATG